MKKTILTILAALTVAAGANAATVTYVSESAWLSSSAWSTWAHSQTTESFDSYALRSYFTTGDESRGSQSVPIVSGTYYSSVPANTMLLYRTQGDTTGTYNDNSTSYSHNPFRVENATTGGIAAIGGQFLSFFKNASTDSFRMSFGTGVSAVSLLIGDLGDGFLVNTRLEVKDQNGATLWNSNGQGTHTYNGQSMTTGNNTWAFLGFTTDAADGLSFLDFTLSGNNVDNIGIDQVRFNTVPEPSAVSLLALGLGGLVALRRMRRSAV